MLFSAKKGATPAALAAKAAFLALLAAACVPASAQEDAYPHHNLTLGIGGATPTGQIQSFMGSAPAISLGYGYRFHRYFQADAGLNILFGAAKIQDVVSTDLGYTQLKDREYMIPLGGRAIAPLMNGRLLLSGGGGVAYLRYSESLNQPSYYYSVACPTCTARGGWGYYGLADAQYFLDEDKHFRVGITTQFVHAQTNGQALGDVPALQTTDHWINVFAALGFSF